MKAGNVLPRRRQRSGMQRTIRRRSAGLPLHDAVRLAVSQFFHFTHTAEHATALWCKRERVWLGNKTFLDWALSDATIDVPWLVAKASDAPEEADELEEAVRSELLNRGVAVSNTTG